MTLQSKQSSGPGAGLKPEVKHFLVSWMIKNVSELFFSIHKAHKGFLITCGSIFNGHLACFFFFFKLFIASLVCPPPQLLL